MIDMQLRLQVVTPMFLFGADQQPELRAPSLRGTLRFWLRAALGGVIGDNEFDRLRCLEAAVFGETEAGSAIIVRILDNPGGGSVPALSQQGIGYLWFSMKGRNMPDRQAINARTEFRVLLQHRRGHEALLRRASEALWLLTRLGGIGARSRRGAGSLQIKQVHGWAASELIPVSEALTPAALQVELTDGLRQIRASIREWVQAKEPSSMSPTEFDVIHPDTCKVWVLDKAFESWHDALEALGFAMRSFRSRLDPDYGNVKGALQGNELTEPVQRAIFGLPIVFYFRSLQGERGTLQGDDHDRRSSPLFVHVAQLTSGKCALVLTFFCAKLLPDGEQLKLRRKGPAVRVNTPSWTPLDSFLTNIDSSLAPRLEVNYR